MVRVPKFFLTLSSNNLTPSYPVTYSIRASTHHWRGELMETWAVAELEYQNPYQTENALAFLKAAFLALQETQEPSQDIIIDFPDEASIPVALTDEEQVYYDAVQLATSKGWSWEETFNENQITGERTTMGGSAEYRLSLDTWQWGGRNLGSSVAFSHFKKENESKADFLLRILETSERAKQDFPDSIPCTNIYGQIEKDAFKTRIVFGH